MINTQGQRKKNIRVMPGGFCCLVLFICFARVNGKFRDTSVNRKELPGLRDKSSLFELDKFERTKHSSGRCWVGGLMYFL